MSLVHMFPEAVEIYNMWSAKEKIERPFPLPYVMFFIGYFLILSIDRVATRACGVKHSHVSVLAVNTSRDPIVHPRDNTSEIEMEARNGLDASD